MGDVYNWSAVLRTEYNVINDNCGAHRVNSLRVSDSRSRVAEPRGCEGIARPTAALLRSLQWVSDSRSRYAEPLGCDVRCAMTCMCCTVSCLSCAVSWRDTSI